MQVYEVCGFDAQVGTSTLSIALTSDIVAGEEILIAVAYQVGFAASPTITDQKTVATYPARQPDVSDITGMNTIVAPCVWMDDTIGGAYLGISNYDDGSGLPYQECVFGGIYTYYVNEALSIGDIITIDYSSRALPFNHPFKWLSARLHRAVGVGAYNKAFESLGALADGVTTSERPLFGWLELYPNWNISGETSLLAVPFSMTDITQWYREANNAVDTPGPAIRWVMGNQPRVGFSGFSADSFNTTEQYSLDRTIFRHTTNAPYYQDHGLHVSYAFETITLPNNQAVYQTNFSGGGVIGAEIRPDTYWGISFDTSFVLAILPYHLENVMPLT